MESNIFFETLLNFLMSWNSLFNSPKRFHISFSFSLDSSCFLFFQQFIFSGYLSLFLFSFWDPFFNLFFFNLIKITSLHRLLFKNRHLISYCFIVLRVLSQGDFQLSFALVRFKENVKIAFQIKTTPFGRTIYFWEDIRINILKNILINW